MEKKKIEDSPWNTDLANSLLTADVQQMMDDKGSGLDAGGMALHYVNDNDTVQACAEEMWRLRIGSVVAKNAASGDIAGIVTERDFVKALATEVQPGTRAVSETLLVSDVMTPANKLVWVTPEVRVGDCMDLMREHGIRHLPVVCEDTARNVLEGKMADQEAMLKRLRKTLGQVKGQFRDSLGEAEGEAAFEAVAADPDAHRDDSRPMARRAADLALKVAVAKAQQSENRARMLKLGSSAGDPADMGGAAVEQHLVGILSIKDILMTVTKNYIDPILQWHEEETRILEVEERHGYSE